MMNPKSFVASTSRSVCRDVGTLSDNEDQTSNEGEEEMEYESDSSGGASR